MWSARFRLGVAIIIPGVKFDVVLLNVGMVAAALSMHAFWLCLTAIELVLASPTS